MVNHLDSMERAWVQFPAVKEKERMNKGHTIQRDVASKTGIDWIISYWSVEYLTGPCIGWPILVLCLGLADLSHIYL